MMAKRRADEPGAPPREATPVEAAPDTPGAPDRAVSVGATDDAGRSGAGAPAATVELEPLPVEIETLLWFG